MNSLQLIEYIESGSLDSRLSYLYGRDSLDFQRKRYADAVNEFMRTFGGEREANIFSVSGRTEISGNHTDHNCGRVVAASVDLDIVAVAAKRDDSIICVKSEGYDTDTVDTASYTAPKEELFGSSASIIAGVSAGLFAKGFCTGGFDAYTTSRVPGGAGLSSSAAFENVIGTVINHLYNGGKVSNVEIAKISQYAENVFFGKPCGLMDQIACAYGGIVAIDFADPKEPMIEKLDFDLADAGYALCIIKTGSSHADLTDEYAAIPAEMKAVAKALGGDVLRKADKDALLRALPSLRKEVGDRAILRAMHFFDENERVADIVSALRDKDIERFFEVILASGRSSFCYLQNVFSTKNVSEQGVSLALCLAETNLSGKGGAWRVHGGGFAGTVQAFVPLLALDEFKKNIELTFGNGSCIALNVRPEGAAKLI